MHYPARHYYEFGPYRLETNERVLERDGHFVPLTPKAFETLLVLVESGGRILDKEHLLKKVWPDTFVEEVSLAKKVSILRKILGEDDGHHYIETIPRRGYRFVAEVREVWQEEERLQRASSLQTSSQFAVTAKGLASELPTANSEQRTANRELPSDSTARVGRWGWVAALLTVSVVAGWGIWQWVYRAPLQAAKPALNALPLTSYQGRENQVAFSPDGNQIAFVWNGPQGDNTDIYVKLLDAETPLRLTTNPAQDINPVWSPDGRYIAFLRQATDNSEFYLVPVLGGAERKVATIFPYQVPGDGNSPYFSPDGKHLVIPDKKSSSDPIALHSLTLDTGEKRRLTAPPAGMIGDYCPALSPDGKWLAFIRSPRWSTDDLYVMPVAGGEPKRITFDNLPINGLTWTPDSREIIFTSRRGGSTRHLWRVAATGGTPERVETIGNDVLSPALSLQGNRLAYTQALDDINIWRIELDAAGKVKGQRELIASTFGDHAPDYSPDGKQIVFASGRSGNNAIWVCESDGSKPRLVHSCGPYVTGSPRWSPHGRWIAFDSRSCIAGATGNPDIYLLSVDGGQPRRLTEDSAEDVVPSWSRDGRWIYFGSNRSGSMQIWRMPTAGGQPLQVTAQGGYEAFESADGAYLYYTKGRGVAGIWKMPTTGGKEEFVTDHHQAGLWRYWRVTEQGIYFATASAAGSLLEFYNFATKQITEVTRLERGAERYVPGLAVSPDGRSLLYCRMDHSGSDIMMVENFR